VNTLSLEQFRELGDIDRDRWRHQSIVSPRRHSSITRRRWRIVSRMRGWCLAARAAERSFDVHLSDHMLGGYFNRMEQSYSVTTGRKQ
jgi:hypothetical protein